MCSAGEGDGGGGAERRGNRGGGLLGGEERCEAKVRQMVADNEDVERQGGRLASSWALHGGVLGGGAKVRGGGTERHRHRHRQS